MKSAGDSHPPRETHGLTFHWPHPPQISLTLVGFLLLSVFVHALAFYIFQVKYPLTTTIPPPPAQVNVLDAAQENQALLKWIDSEDPAAIANPHEIVPGNLLDIPYKPSFAEIRTSPKLFEQKEPSIVFPPARSPLYVINSGMSPAQSVAAAPSAQKTDLKFSGQLAARKIRKQPSLQLSTRGDSTPLEPATFFVGVGADGKVQYTFLINSFPDHSGSGNDAIDHQAEAHLRRVEFVPAGQSITWGFATYFWGSDAFDPASVPQTP